MKKFDDFYLDLMESLNIHGQKIVYLMHFRILLLIEKILVAKLKYQVTRTVKNKS